MSNQPKTVDIHVGSRIRQRRLVCAQTQTSLANQIGLTFQQLQKYENGTNRVSASRLWEIAKILEVSPEWFFAGLSGQPVQSNELARNEALELARSIQAMPSDVRKRFGAALSSVADLFDETDCQPPH